MPKDFSTPAWADLAPKRGATPYSDLAKTFLPVASHFRAQGPTTLTPDEEQQFQAWVKDNNITDLDHPNSHYDYRGFWKKYPNFRHNPGEHYTDEFKLPGHESFSVESNYATPANYGGRWDEDTYLPQLSSSRKDLIPDQLANSVGGLMRGETNNTPAMLEALRKFGGR